MLSDIAGTMMEVSKTLQKISMYPFFDAANYILMCSIVKEDSQQTGSGYLEMKLFERLIRGVWLPASNEFLQPTFTSKASVFISIAFLLEKIGNVPSSHDNIFLGAIMFLVYFKLSSMIIGIHDPFLPFENIFCSLFLGGLADAFKRATESGQPVQQTADGGPGGQSASTNGSSSPAAASSTAAANSKSKEEKKRE